MKFPCPFLHLQGAGITIQLRKKKRSKEQMEEIKKILEEILNIDLIGATLSNPRKKEEIVKVKVRPVLIKDVLFFQCETHKNRQVFHENYEYEQALHILTQDMELFRQMQIETKEFQYTVLVSKKGKVTVQKKRTKGEKRQAELSHNRTKNYILKEGVQVPFLQDLGVMTADGKVVRSKFDKFRQINRFLEFIEDILPKLEKDREITILDFGCGKSYLTFAMYYYLHVLKEYDIRIIGLDLKSDVIHHCNELSRKYGYDKLEFLVGDIADYEGVREVDMVVTLHACDTATDFALAKAVGWNAKVILSVPCCQHELNGQMQREGAGYDKLAPILDYGLLKERFAALLTDGLRAKYLEQSGYETQVLEFIDMEHTPKNILLRAVKTNQAKQGSESQVWECRKFLGIDPMLGVLLDKGTES